MNSYTVTAGTTGLDNSRLVKTTGHVRRTLYPLFLIFHCVIMTAADIRASERQDGPIVFYHESHDEPELALLRERYDFEDYMSREDDEFQRMALLKDWVFKKLRYERNFRYHGLRNSLKILDLAKKREPMLCTNFSAVFMQCAVSMGWTAR